MSLRNDQPVTQQILERMPATAELAFASMLVAVLHRAYRSASSPRSGAGTAIDFGAMTLSLVGISMPNFWLGPLLAIIFAVELGWLPVGGRGTLRASCAARGYAGRRARGDPGAHDARQPARRAARAVCAGRARQGRLAHAGPILHHAFRNSLIPIVTILGLQFGVVLTGAVITETIFAWPGIGRLLIQSISFRDYPLVQGCVLLIAVTYVGVNLLTDLTYSFLDPRIRVDRS